MGQVCFAERHVMVVKRRCIKGKDDEDEYFQVLSASDPTILRFPSYDRAKIQSSAENAPAQTITYSLVVSTKIEGAIMTALYFCRSDVGIKAVIPMHLSHRYDTFSRVNILQDLSAEDEMKFGCTDLHDPYQAQAFADLKNLMCGFSVNTGAAGVGKTTWVRHAVGAITHANNGEVLIVVRNNATCDSVASKLADHLRKIGSNKLVIRKRNRETELTHLMAQNLPEDTNGDEDKPVTFFDQQKYRKALATLVSAEVPELQNAGDKVASIAGPCTGPKDTRFQLADLSVESAMREMVGLKEGPLSTETNRQKHGVFVGGLQRRVIGNSEAQSDDAERASICQGRTCTEMRTKKPTSLLRRLMSHMTHTFEESGAQGSILLMGQVSCLRRTFLPSRHTLVTNLAHTRSRSPLSSSPTLSRRYQWSR